MIPYHDLAFILKILIIMKDSAKNVPKDYCKRILELPPSLISSLG
jgi:hypothetical protein